MDKREEPNEVDGVADMGAAAERMAWWREARFGMFIHWGLYALPAGVWNGRDYPGIGEWIFHWADVPEPEYATLAGQFSPQRFDAAAWVALAQAAGMRYLVITAKHADGFAMFHSACDGFNIVDATPFGRDPLAELAAACQRAGLPLGFYYSQAVDRHHPGGHNAWCVADAPAEAFTDYLETKVKPQLRELLTGYGPVCLIWFDNPVGMTPGQSAELRDFVRALQPDCLVSGRIGHGIGDYGSLGDNQLPAGPVVGDWETPATLNDTWGYKRNDHNWKSPQYLLRLLSNCAGKGVNYLLNVGPTAEGTIPEPSAERLREVGAWMRAHGEAIYGTSANPFGRDFTWGCATGKPRALYLHLWDWPTGNVMELAGLRSRVEHARLLSEQPQTLEYTQARDSQSGRDLLRLTLPALPPDDHVAIIALDLAGPVETDPLPGQEADGSLVLPAHLARLAGPDGMRLGPAGAVEGWTTDSACLTWRARFHHPGHFRVQVQSHVDRDRQEDFADHLVCVTVGEASVAGLAGRKDLSQDPAVNHWQTVSSEIGALTVDAVGELEITLRARRLDPASAQGLTACGLLLLPAGAGESEAGADPPA